ncbi:MAG: chemotaxis response regulator protein-glutamate methylesterase [Myxococcales bacterium]|nr:chemotaxis response regulator protein-glutamate methylesterase [Myxococcales bacterium]
MNPSPWRPPSRPTPAPAAPVRVLVVDDSAVIRRVLKDGLSKDPLIEVVGVAADAYEARDKILDLNPNVITLDLEMPRMNGIEFLKKLMAQYPLPVIIVSGLSQSGAAATVSAMAAGAFDFVTKPSSSTPDGVALMMDDLRRKVRLAGRAPAQSPGSPRSGVAAPQVVKASPAVRPVAQESNGRMIAIGASTGGTEAIAEVMSALPADCEGVVIVQHMPAGFTRAFAERLDRLSQLRVREAQDGDAILRGEALVAPGGQQLRVVRSQRGLRVQVGPGPLVSGHSPSVDVLMTSVAEACGGNAAGVVLTGMGRDGANGLLALRNAGGRTWAQDEATSIVWGMPRACHEVGAAERLLPLNAVASALASFRSSR